MAGSGMGVMVMLLTPVKAPEKSSMSAGSISKVIWTTLPQGCCVGALVLKLRAGHVNRGARGGFDRALRPDEESAGDRDVASRVQRQAPSGAGNVANGHVFRGHLATRGLEFAFPRGLADNQTRLITPH